VRPRRSAGVIRTWHAWREAFENLGDLEDSFGTHRERQGMRRLRHGRGNPDTELGRSLRRLTAGAPGLTRRRKVGRVIREESKADGSRGVGSAHSTQRAGEPSAGGRG